MGVEEDGAGEGAVEVVEILLGHEVSFWEQKGST